MSCLRSWPSGASKRSLVFSDVEQNNFLFSSECDKFFDSSSDDDRVSVNDIFDQNELESAGEIDNSDNETVEEIVCP